MGTLEWDPREIDNTYSRIMRTQRSLRDPSNPLHIGDPYDPLRGTAGKIVS